MFATNIGALERQGISQVLTIITLAILPVMILLRGKQMARNLSSAIASKLRIEQNAQTPWHKGNSLQRMTPASPVTNQSSEFRISTVKASGMLINVVTRSAMAMFTTKWKATFCILRVRRVTDIIKTFPIKDTTIIRAYIMTLVKYWGLVASLLGGQPSSM